jgi:hypothetical protein
MSRIKKGMMELEETKRINRELTKILQQHEHIAHQDNRHFQPVNSNTVLPCRSVQKSKSRTVLLLSIDGYTSPIGICRIVYILKFRTTTTTAAQPKSFVSHQTDGRQPIT